VEQVERAGKNQEAIQLSPISAKKGAEQDLNAIKNFINTLPDN
jgi:hypothetical protein